MAGRRSSTSENYLEQLRNQLEDERHTEDTRFDSPERDVLSESDHNTDSEQSLDFECSDDSDPDDPTYEPIAPKRTRLEETLKRCQRQSRRQKMSQQGGIQPSTSAQQSQPGTFEQQQASEKPDQAIQSVPTIRSYCSGRDGTKWYFEPQDREEEQPT